MSIPLRVLLVEDSEDDAILLQGELKRGGYAPFLLRVETPAEMKEALDHKQWDIIISDYSLPRFSGLAALELFQRTQLDLPFIILSGNIGEDIAVEAMKAGAHDYIMKDNLKRLTPAIQRELREAIERSARRKAELAIHENEKRFRSLIENSSDVTTVLDAYGAILYQSPSVERVLGYTPEDLLGKTFWEYIHTDDAGSVSTAFVQRFLQPDAVSIPVEFRFRHADGTWRFLEALNGKLLQDASGPSIVVNSRDITARKRDEQTIRHLAYYDALTNLPNRTLFHDRLTLALAQAHRSKQRLAVMILDLDRFKTITDTLGHAVGDRILANVGKRLEDSLREGDTVARSGGDEFMLLLPGLSGVEDAGKIAQKILGIFATPFLSGGEELHVTASIGVCLYPSDGEDAETLIKNADVTMYRAKEQGRNNYQLYAPGMNAKAHERLSLENRLRRALEQDQFVVYYQPQISLHNGRMVGVEALVRWQHPELGLLFPGSFIPIAEESGLILPLSEWVLQTACAQNKSWQESGMPPLRMAVNLSARHFMQKDLVDTVKRILRDTRLEAEYLEIELTESIFMGKADAATATLRELKAMGAHLSIDDFGTGFSSLSYLKRFPVSTLKIDQSFVQDIPNDADDAAIAQLIIAMAHSLNLRVIAEGVETQEQLDFLRSHDCDEMQGFLFSKAVPPEQIPERQQFTDADSTTGNLRKSSVTAKRKIKARQT